MKRRNFLKKALIAGPVAAMVPAVAAMPHGDTTYGVCVDPARPGSDKTAKVFFTRDAGGRVKVIDVELQ